MLKTISCSSLCVVALMLAGANSALLAAGANILDVQLALKDGYIRVDKAKTTLTLGADYTNWFRLSHDQIHQELTSYLDKVFKERGRVIEQVLTTNALSLWKHGKLDRHSLDGWDVVTTNWNQDFILGLENWITEHSDLAAGHVLSPIYNGLLGFDEGKPIEPPYESSPLDPLQKDAEPGPDFPAGRIKFALISPITPHYVGPDGIRSREQLGTEEWPGGIRNTDLSRTLNGLQGQLWFRFKIERQLTDYLESRGVPVEIEPANSKSGPPDRAGLKIERPILMPTGVVTHDRILFSHDPLLRGIFVRVPPSDTNSLSRALYMVLPSDDFRIVSAHLSDPNWFRSQPDPFSQSSVPGETNYMVHLSLMNLPGSALRSSQQFVTGRFLAERLRYLEIAGFSADKWNGANVTASKTNRYKTVELVISPKGSKPEERKSESDEGEERLVDVQHDRGTNYIQPQSFEAESSKHAEDLRRLTYEPDFPNFARAGVEYSPRQPLRYFAGYTRAGFAGPNTFSGDVGWQKELSGQAAYTRDFFVFDSIRRRLQLSLRGFSDFQPDRLIAGQQLNERRTGGEASASLDLVRDLDNHWLRLDLIAGYREVTLDNQSVGKTREGLVSADLGFLYFRASDGTPGSARLELQPRIRLAHVNQTGDYFIKPSFEFSYHRFISSFFQWDCNGNGSWISAEALTSEWPTFGGVSSVRGYRADAGVGRETWAVQNELWFPLRKQFRCPETIGRLVRRNLAFATFVDIGGVHDSADSFSGVKAGAGLGLRFVYNDYLTLRLDWAHAIDESSRRRGGSVFYFSITTRNSL